MKRYDMELPEAVRAYFLLNAANMTDDMTMFGDSSDNDRTTLPIKEDCLVGYTSSSFGSRSNIIKGY